MSSNLEITTQLVLSAAMVLRDYCKQIYVCEDCPLGQNQISCFETVPEDWELPEGDGNNEQTD